MRLMREAINQQHVEIARLTRNIESSNHQLRKKNEVIAQLKNRLYKYENTEKNSGNSCMPPSKERLNPNRSLEKASCHFLMTAIRKTALYILDP